MAYNDFVRYSVSNSGFKKVYGLVETDLERCLEVLRRQFRRSKSKALGDEAIETEYRCSNGRDIERR